MALTSLSNTYKYKLFCHLHMLWVCIWMSSYNVTASLVGSLCLWNWKLPRIMGLSQGATKRTGVSVTVEAIYQTKMTPTAMLNL